MLPMYMIGLNMAILRTEYKYIQVYIDISKNCVMVFV